jgi:transcription antitermination factor NusB
MTAGKRRTAREMAVQMLYQSDLGGSPLPNIFNTFDLAEYLARPPAAATAAGKRKGAAARSAAVSVEEEGGGAGLAQAEHGRNAGTGAGGGRNGGNGADLAHPAHSAGAGHGAGAASGGTAEGGEGGEDGAAATIAPHPPGAPGAAAGHRADQARQRQRPAGRAGTGGSAGRVEEAFQYAQRLVRGTVDHREEIDAMIRGQADNWRLERMPAVDRNILRLAIYEMLYERETPKLVVVDEAIELAKKFGSEQSGRFVNGLLDGLLKQHTFPGTLT